MAGVGPNDLFELAAELRDILVEALDTIPDATATDGFDMSTLEGAPGHVYVSPAAPLADCCDTGMLAVHVNNITDRFAKAAKPDEPKLNVPSLIATLLRCVPIGEEAPPPEEEEAAARQTLADGWVLWQAGYEAIRSDVFLEKCLRAEFVSCQSIRPDEGQCAGWQLTFLVALDGYAIPFGT